MFGWGAPGGHIGTRQFLPGRLPMSRWFAFTRLMFDTR
jgi:hypothetical protein